MKPSTFFASSIITSAFNHAHSTAPGVNQVRSTSTNDGEHLNLFEVNVRPTRSPMTSHPNSPKQTTLGFSSPTATTELSTKACFPSSVAS
jgi:hypothetical protein